MCILFYPKFINWYAVSVPSTISRIGSWIFLFEEIVQLGDSAQMAQLNRNVQGSYSFWFESAHPQTPSVIWSKCKISNRKKSCFHTMLIAVNSFIPVNCWRSRQWIGVGANNHLIWIHVYSCPLIGFCQRLNLASEKEYSTILLAYNDIC